MGACCKDGSLNPLRLVMWCGVPGEDDLHHFFSHFTVACSSPQADPVLCRPLTAPAEARGFACHRAGCWAAQALEEALV